MKDRPIKLDQFLKRSGVVMSGGAAKHLIQEGSVRVNGVVETRRGRKLRPGDRVQIGGQELIVRPESSVHSNRPSTPGDDVSDGQDVTGADAG